jgi:integrase
LLPTAGEHLRASIEAVCETGMRRGELLGLEWQDVRCDSKGKAEWIVLQPETIKTDRMRTIPASERLVKLLARRRNGPDAEPHGADAPTCSGVAQRPANRVAVAASPSRPSI